MEDRDLLNMQAHLATSILEDIDDGEIDTASFLARVELLAVLVCEATGKANAVLAEQSK